MAPYRLAVSVIAYNRSPLLDLCLKSLDKAMQNLRYPVYLVVQDPSEQDEKVIKKYNHLLTKVFITESMDRNVEDLINLNRITAWRIALIDEENDYVVCLEDDVEISPDFFSFTEQVITQNSQLKSFRGINYGSFETQSGVGSYSRVRYGLHGPASLISKRTFKSFNTKKLLRLNGLIPWDSWVEPITKKGFMATSNTARYKDNGINGTHASIEQNKEYFNKLTESFEYGVSHPMTGVHFKSIQHTWRSDCVAYQERDLLRYTAMSVATRVFQLLKLVQRLPLLRVLKQKNDF